MRWRGLSFAERIEATERELLESWAFWLCRIFWAARRRYQGFFSWGILGATRCWPQVCHGWRFPQNRVAIEKIQRFGSGVLDEIFRILNVAHVRCGSGSLNEGQPRNVWPYLHFEMPADIARAALVCVQLLDVVAKIANQA